jgi:hypothetical protein
LTNHLSRHPGAKKTARKKKQGWSVEVGDGGGGGGGD